MRTWYAVYEDELPTPVIVEEGQRHPGILERFRAASKKKAIGGRAVTGMWIIDADTEQQDVPEAWGRCPGDIHIRNKAYKARRKKY